MTSARKSVRSFVRLFVGHHQTCPAISKPSDRGGSTAARADSGAGKAGMAKNRSGPAKILIHQVLVLI